jgi:hypothetical protein
MRACTLATRPATWPHGFDRSMDRGGGSWQAAGPLAYGLATHALLGIDAIEPGKGGGQTNPPIDQDRFRDGGANVARTPSNTRPRMPIKGQTTDAASI